MSPAPDHRHRVTRRRRRPTRATAVALVGSGVVVLALVGCAEPATVFTDPASVAPATTSADPVVAHCESLGGAVFGPEPMCGLPDGTSVDARDLYRSATSGGPTTPPTPTPSKPSTSKPSPTVPATTAPPTTSPATPAGTVAALATEIGATIVSDIAEGPCGSNVVMIADGRFRFFAWRDGAWSDESVMLVHAYPDTVAITSVDLTGDDVIDYLLERPNADSLTGRSGTVLASVSGAGIYGDGSYGCAWEWQGFRLDDPALGTNRPVLDELDGLRYEGGRLLGSMNAYKSLDTNALVEYDRSEFEFVVTWPDELNGYDPAPVRPVTSCGGIYDYDDSLPISVCSQGLSVRLFQEGMGQVDADGYFGPGTHAALIDLQRRLGVPVTGVIDVATWAALGVTSGVPYPDLDGNGVVDGSEFPAG